eukprot:COSAG03_NODE_19004_length_344_cov_0.828571_1_plen_23_part_01
MQEERHAVLREPLLEPALLERFR